LLHLFQDKSIYHLYYYDEYGRTFGRIARLESSSERSRNEIEEMKGRLKIVKMAKTLESVEEKGTDSKYRINQLVKEIDKCIAMLNS